MRLLHHLIFIFSILSVSISGFAQSPEAAGNRRVVRIQDQALTKVIELYNSRMYEDALQFLDENKKLSETNPLWYYYKGLCFARLERFDDSILSFEAYVQKVDMPTAARGYYFIGLMEFYKGKYERAITSLDVALDVSKDPKLDRSIDNLMDKVIRYSNYYKNRKKTNLGFLIGYGYDTNAIDVSQTLSDTKLSGHVLNYGFSASHRLIDKIDFVMEPSLTVLDKYTFSGSFKNESTLQQADILQAVFSIPALFHSNNEESNTQYEFSLNAFTSFVPVQTSKRDQYLSSQYLKARVSTDLSNSFRVNLYATMAAEQNVTVVDEDSNATGVRSEAKFILNQFLTKNRDVGLGYNLRYLNKTALGSDAKYTTAEAAVEYWAPSFFDTSSMISLTAAQLKYPERADARLDNLVSIDIYLSKKNDEALSEWTLLLGSANNKSNVDVNTYNDMKVGLSYSKQFSF